MDARIRAGTLPVALCLFASCTSFTEPELSSTDGFVDGQLRVTLSFAPRSVVRPAGVLATLTLENLGSEELEFGTGMCLAIPEVFLGAERIPFRGTQWGCGWAGTSRKIDGHGELTVEYPLLLTPGHRAGAYRFVARLTTDEHRDLEVTFSVR
jgi:hypothetical protein